MNRLEYDFTNNSYKKTNWVIIPEALAKRIAEKDELAIQDVIALFEPLIHREARRKYVTENGKTYFAVDSFIKGYIEGRLMEALLRFPME